MWSALRARALLPLSSSPHPSLPPPWKLGFLDRTLCSTALENDGSTGGNSSSMFLNLQEVEKVLSDVKADNVKVIPVSTHCEWSDYMVLATGRSSWHVKNIAQALIYQTKQKQKGAERLLLPNVEGQESGKWIVIDSGPIVVHALDENARAYYGLESLWTVERSQEGPKEDLGKAFVKVRRINNSKKRVQRSA